MLIPWVDISLVVKKAFNLNLIAKCLMFQLLSFLSPLFIVVHEISFV